MIGTATALVILGASIAPFVTPLYVRFEQDRTAVAALTGYSPAELDQATTSILGDLVLWRGDFHVSIIAGPTGGPVLGDADRAHMLDVRRVFTGFWVLVLAAVAVLALAFRRARDTDARVATMRAVRNGARGLAVVIAIVGVFAVVAFDAAFEVFHRLFFSPGTYTFDPATDKLVQLFPEQFWSETAIVVGAVVIAAALVTAWQVGRRAARIGSVA